MPADDAFSELVEHVGAFHITDRAMVRAQRDVEAALRGGGANDEARARYLDSVRRYFEGFDREARTRLQEVDRRLAVANQVQFNLAAERGVAVKRIEATRAILDELASLAGRAP